MSIYLALYKGKKSGKTPKALMLHLADWAVRKTTGGIYSHCEIARLRRDGDFDCYGASLRDGGVRMKTMKLPEDKWDLRAIRDEHAEVRLSDFFRETRGLKYDYWGALGVILRTRHSEKRWFCSEWCAAVLGVAQPERLSPNDLAKYYVIND